MPDPRRVPAIRVPSLVPDRWVYLRGATIMFGHINRTWSTGSHNAVAFQEGDRIAAYIRHVPIPRWDAGPFSTLDKAIDALEDHLVSLGAEVVPPGEWPDGGDGTPHRADRIPFRTDDYDAWYALPGDNNT